MSEQSGERRDDVPEELGQLLGVCTRQEAAELKTLYNAQIQCLKAYQQDPTAQRKRDWDAARQGYEERVSELWQRYMAREEYLKNRLEAVKWLKDRGYTVGKSKLYADTKAGQLKVCNDGSIRVSDLEDYVARQGLEPLEQVTEPEEGAEDLQREIKREQLRQLQLDNERREFERQRQEKQYIPRKDLELELVSRAGVLDTGLRSDIKAHARDWVHLVGGRAERVPDLVEAMLDVLDRRLNEYARMDRFEVIFEDNEDNEEGGE
jgi:hypothetical protein